MSDSTQGQAEPQSVQGTDEPKNVAVTPEMLNAAITARFKSLEKKVEESVGGMLTGFTTKLNESLSAQFEALKPKAEPTKEEKAKPSTPADDPFVKQLQQQIEALTKQNQRTEAERKAERSKARDVTLRAQVANALTANGIPAPLAKKAVFELVDGTKRVAWESDESDSLMFRTDDGDVADLETGLKGWLGSEDAKFYKPASGAAGSGDRAGNGKTTAPASKEAKALDLLSQHLGLGR